MVLFSNTKTETGSAPILQKKALEVLRISVIGLQDLPIRRKIRSKWCCCSRRQSQVHVFAKEIDPRGDSKELPATYVFPSFIQAADGCCHSSKESGEDTYIELQLQSPKSRIRFEVSLYKDGKLPMGFAEMDIVRTLRRKRYWEALLCEPDTDEALYGTDNRRPATRDEHPSAGFRRPSFLRIHCWIVRYGGVQESSASTPQTSTPQSAFREKAALTRNATGKLSLGSLKSSHAPPVPLKPPEHERKDPSRKRVMIFTRGTRGDVQPFAALARGLAQPPYNCEVVIVTEVCWKMFIDDCRVGLADRHSIRFRPSGGNTMKRVSHPVSQWVLSAGAGCDALQLLVLSRSEAEFFPSEGMFFHWAHVMKPDFIVHGFTQTNIAMIVSEALQIPIVGFILQPAKGLELRTPSPNSVMDELFGPVRAVIDHPSFNAMLQQVMEKIPDGKSLNPFRRSRGLSPCPFDITNEDRQAAELMNQGIPRIVPINPLVLGRVGEEMEEAGMTLTDFIFLRLRSDSLSAELSEFIENARRANRQVVLLTFSSMPVGERRILRIACDICQKCLPQADPGEEANRPAFIAMCAGQGFDPPDKELEEEVEALQKGQQLMVLRKGAPFGALFPAVDAILLHGGLGVTSEAVLAGKPTVTSGVLLMDQRFWAARMNEVGVGSIGVSVDAMSEIEDEKEGLPYGVKLMMKALDKRTSIDAPTWAINARELKREIEEKAGVGSDGVARNAQAVFEAGTDPNKRRIVENAYRENFLKSCNRQFMCCVNLAPTCLHWCCCTQMPGCVKLWLRLFRRCFRCGPLRRCVYSLFYDSKEVVGVNLNYLDDNPRREGSFIGNYGPQDPRANFHREEEEPSQKNAQEEIIIQHADSTQSWMSDLSQLSSDAVAYNLPGRDRTIVMI